MGIKLFLTVISTFSPCYGLLNNAIPRFSDTEKPNFIIILADDLDALGSTIFMRNTNEYVKTRGVKLENAFATTPVCCPARSSLLTGLYQHSHLALNNTRNGGCDSERWQKVHEPKALGAVLQKAGYRTFYAGKYLNEYKGKTGERVPPGWDWWAGLHGNSVYYNYTINVNGTSRYFGDSEEDYLTDVLSGWVADFLRMPHSEQPFLMMVATPAPHAPFTPSAKYKDHFKNIRAPRLPNFNAGRANKHWLVRSGGHLTAEQVAAVDQVYRSRLETLLSVDDLIEVATTLAPPNTFVIVTSDHGFHAGQFSQGWDKRQPYESDIRVPLYMWGPTVPAGASLYQPVLNIDIAPTLFDMAGVQRPPPSDGRSFRHLFDADADKSSNEMSALKSLKRSFLIEYHGEGDQGAPCYNDTSVALCEPVLGCKCFDARNNSYTCTRTISWDVDELYCRFQDKENFIESYDMKKDPYQLHNLANANNNGG